MLTRRAERAQIALKAYVDATTLDPFDCQSHEEWLIDAMTDLMHLAAETGLNPRGVMALARSHFVSEQVGAS